MKNVGILSKIYKYIIAATIIIVPLYPKFPFIQIPGTYVTIRFEDFILAVLAVLAFLVLVRDPKRIFKNSITKSMLIFLLVGFISLLSGIFLTQTVIPSIGALHYLRRIEYFMPFIAIMAFSKFEGDKNLEFYIKTLILTVLIVFLYGMGQRYLGLPVIMTQNAEASKGIAMRWTPGAQLTSTFAGHYDLAAFMVMCLPIFISLIFVFKDKISKTILIAVSLVGFWLLINTASRISFVSFLIGTSVSMLFLKKYKALLIILIASVVLGSFSMNLFGRYKRLIDVYFNKVKSMVVTEVHPGLAVYAQDKVTFPSVMRTPTPTPAPKFVFEDRSTSIRLNVEWPAGIRAFEKNPLIGTGYSSIGLAADNDYLRLLAEVGLLGFIAFGLIIMNILINLISNMPLTRNLSGVKLGFSAGIFGSIAGVLINAFFIDVFEASKFAIIFWLLVGLAVFSLNSNQDEQ